MTGKTAKKNIYIDSTSQVHRVYKKSSTPTTRICSILSSKICILKVVSHDQPTQMFVYLQISCVPLSTRELVMDVW